MAHSKRQFADLDDILLPTSELFQSDHAVLMVQFAHRISKEMSKVTHMLETTLGPDTSDLLLRIGIHTGPVTAGVIRGDKARFQLFGVS